MLFIEGNGVPSHETAHHLAYRSRTCSQKNMKMVRNQSPGVTLGLSFFEDAGEPFQERLTIFVVKEDVSSFDSPGHHMLEKAGGVKSGLAGHFVYLDWWNQNSFGRPACFRTPFAVCRDLML